MTTFLEMTNTEPAAVARELDAQKRALAAGKSLVNYGFYIGATADNVADHSRIRDHQAALIATRRAGCWAA